MLLANSYLVGYHHCRHWLHHHHHRHRHRHWHHCCTHDHCQCWPIEYTTTVYCMCWAFQGNTCIKQIEEHCIENWQWHWRGQWMAPVEKSAGMTASITSLQCNAMRCNSTPTPQECNARLQCNKLVQYYKLYSIKFKFCSLCILSGIVDCTWFLLHWALQ